MKKILMGLAALTAFACFGFADATTAETADTSRENQAEIWKEYENVNKKITKQALSMDKNLQPVIEAGNQIIGNVKDAQAVGESIGVMKGCVTNSDNFRDFGDCVTSHDYQSGILQNAQAATEFVSVTAACATHSDDFVDCISSYDYQSKKLKKAQELGKQFAEEYTADTYNEELVENYAASTTASYTWATNEEYY